MEKTINPQTLQFRASWKDSAKLGPASWGEEKRKNYCKAIVTVSELSVTITFQGHHQKPLNGVQIQVLGMVHCQTLTKNENFLYGTPANVNSMGEIKSIELGNIESYKDLNGGKPFKSLSHYQWWNHLTQEEAGELVKLTLEDPKGITIQTHLVLKGFIGWKDVDESTTTKPAWHAPLKEALHAYSPKINGEPDEGCLHFCQRIGNNRNNIRFMAITSDFLQDVLLFLKKYPEDQNLGSVFGKKEQVYQKIMEICAVHYFKPGEDNSQYSENDMIRTIACQWITRRMLKSSMADFPSWYVTHKEKIPKTQLKNWLEDDESPWNCPQETAVLKELLSKYDPRNYTIESEGLFRLFKHNAVPKTWLEDEEWMRDKTPYLNLKAVVEMILPDREVREILMGKTHALGKALTAAVAESL